MTSRLTPRLLGLDVGARPERCQVFLVSSVRVGSVLSLFCSARRRGSPPLAGNPAPGLRAGSGEEPPVSLGRQCPAPSWWPPGGTNLRQQCQRLCARSASQEQSGGRLPGPLGTLRGGSPASRTTGPTQLAGNPRMALCKLTGGHSRHGPAECPQKEYVIACHCPLDGI